MINLKIILKNYHLVLYIMGSPAAMPHRAVKSKLCKILYEDYLKQYTEYVLLMRRV